MFKQIKRSKLVWRLSGVSYVTAVLATHGTYVSKRNYMTAKRKQMEEFLPMLKDKCVLEFGCGIGGNLFAISNVVRKGVGIDINYGYIRIAERLKKKHNLENLNFLAYSGREIPSRGSFHPEVIFSIGVFERLKKPLVFDYLGQLKSNLRKGGKLIIYFLNEKASHREFTKRLGADAYVFWREEEISEICNLLGMTIDKVSEWENANVYTFSAK